MKRGFTLIELMIVIIIIGVLATIGIVQYQAAVEKSRGAEAKSVIGYLRSQCASLWMESGNVSSCTDGAMNLGLAAGNIPNAAGCLATNFFYYTLTASEPHGMTFTATRCTGGNGKAPTGKGAGTVVLTTNYNTGSDSWTSTGGF